MARARGTTTRFGALLDSTMDRVADGAVFGALTWWFLTSGQRVLGRVALICLVGGQIVSYVKARAEGLGFTLRRRHRGADGAPDPRRRRRPADRLRRRLGPAGGAVAAARADRDHRGPAAGARAPAGAGPPAAPHRVEARRSSEAARRRHEQSGRARLRRRLAADPGAAPVGRLGRCSAPAADRAARKNGPGRAAAASATCAGWSAPTSPRRAATCLVRDGLRSYARYWLEAFRLPKLSRKQILRGFRPRARAPARRGGRGGHRLRGRAAARRQLGLRRRLGLRPRLAADHRRRAAQAGGRVPAVRGLPGGARHGDHPDRPAASRPPLDVLEERLRAGPGACRCWPTGTCPPAASRSSSSAAAPGCRPGRRCWRCGPARRCTSCRCGTTASTPAGRVAGPVPLPAARIAARSTCG